MAGKIMDSEAYRRRDVRLEVTRHLRLHSTDIPLGCCNVKSQIVDVDKQYGLVYRRHKCPKCYTSTDTYEITADALKRLIDSLSSVDDAVRNDPLNMIVRATEQLQHLGENIKKNGELPQ